MITDKVGNRIKELRKIEGISQEKLAFKAELDRIKQKKYEPKCKTYQYSQPRTNVGGVESGKRNLSIKSLEKILNALDISFEEFFENM